MKYRNVGSLSLPEKVPLGIFPTPLVRLDRISEQLGTNVWIKRDDLCGVALGGNKVRKLQYLLAEARNQRYDLIMTTGASQSNHAMLTAACAGKMGMDCVLILKNKGVTQLRGNLVLNHLMGTEVRFMDTDDYGEIYREMDRLGEELGRRVYKIPCGGSNALGSLGYLDCMREVAESGIRFDTVVCACGSGGTAAGTIYGAQLYMPDTRVVCAMVSPDPFDEIVPALMRDMNDLLGIDLPVPVPEILDAVGEGYAIPSEEGNDAMKRMLRSEGIVLDPCYTGKAFGGLIRMARDGRFKKTDNILFLHTGGAGGVFAPFWENL